jgi:UDP-glucose 4-epimerase
MEQLLKGKRVMVTGGLGFIGSSLSIACVEMGAIVTIFDNLDSDSGGNLSNIKEISDSVEIISEDIRNYESLRGHIADKDVIFNCAAHTSHTRSMKDPLYNMDVNTRGVINILEAMRQSDKNGYLVQFGTTTQFGPLTHTPADETHPEFPIDAYSANKMLAEKYVLMYTRVYGINATVVRLSNIYGPRAAIHSSEFTVNNFFIGLALKNKPITVFGSGNQQRNVLYVDDVVDALITVAQSEAGNGQVFLIVSSDHYSIRQVAELTTEVFGSDVIYIDWPTDKLSIDVGDAVFSNKKFCNTYDWTPSTGLREGLVNTQKYFSSKIDSYL